MKLKILKDFGPYTAGQVIENGEPWMVLKKLAEEADIVPDSGTDEFDALFQEGSGQPTAEQTKLKAKIKPSNKAVNKAHENK